MARLMLFAFLLTALLGLAACSSTPPVSQPTVAGGPITAPGNPDGSQTQK